MDMIDNIYRNAFKEVSVILDNTDLELNKKIPKKIIDFIHENMNDKYETNIRFDIDIDKQPLLKETESILSLIYRSYWITSEEKQSLKEKDKLELSELEKKKKTEYKDLQEIFEKRKNINEFTINNELMVIPNDTLFTKIFKKIKNIFKKK